jgi:putative PIN family toxin of toxin-antitoxin system
VLISAYFWNGRERALLWECIKGTHKNVISEYIMGEVKRVLSDKFSLPNNAVERYVSLLTTFSTVVPIGNVYNVSRDPKDNPIIATALNGRVDALITGDNDILTLRDERKMFCLSNHCFKILKPGEFE